RRRRESRLALLPAWLHPGNEQFGTELELAFGVADALHEQAREGTEESISWTRRSGSRWTTDPALDLFQQLGAKGVDLYLGPHEDCGAHRHLLTGGHQERTSFGAAPEHALERRRPTGSPASRAHELNLVGFFPHVPGYLARLSGRGDRLRIARSKDGRGHRDGRGKPAAELTPDASVDHVAVTDTGEKQLFAWVPFEKDLARHFRFALRLGLIDPA